MRQCDKFTVENIAAERQLIENAAKALVKSAEYTPPVCIVCGKGNNGADGLALAVLLQKENIDTTVYLVEDSVSNEGEYFLNILHSSGLPCLKLEKDTNLSKYKTIVDCVLGIGFSGVPHGNAARAIEKINSSGAYVVSADINSGLNGDNGITSTCVKSDLTVAFGAYKYGHFLSSAKDVMKSKAYSSVGIVTECDCAYLIEKEDIRGLFGKRANNSHKGTYGYVTLIGGCMQYSGAAKLANFSLCALRAGCGVSRLAVPRCISNAVAPYLLESTLFPLPSDDEHLIFDQESIKSCIHNSRCVAFGMGVGTGIEQEKILSFILKSYSGRLIIDADGLNNLARLPSDALKTAACRVILTPHIKEFSRLCGLSCEQILADPINIAQKYARDNGVILLLKGPCTVITDGERVYLTDKGSPGMATAGSGDVLSGILAGISGYTEDEKLLLAVAAAAYLNGICGELAAEEFTEIAALSSDTARMIPQGIKNILYL